MKISHFEQIITPEIGTCVAGYYAHDESTEILDDLKLSVLLMDDGKKTGAILGFDLLGLDVDIVNNITRDAAEILGIPESDVILSCTHTHSGPHTRSNSKATPDQKYVASLYNWVKEGVTAAKNGSWVEVDTFFYSCKCDENYNRRFVDGSNHGKYLPMHRSLERIASEFKDQELGLLVFARPGSPNPEGVLVNFAAHPLAGHAAGRGSFRISADFPGMLRDIMEQDCCWCVFVQGAAGDQFPNDAECGLESIRNCARNLAIEVMRGITDAIRNPQLYKLESPELRTQVENLTVKIRNDRLQAGNLPATYCRAEENIQIKLFAIGDICLIGVPGELLAELGQEMKWHSPFRRTFILYNSTAYLSYLCHANAFIPGGYEPKSSYIQPFEGFKIVAAAIEGMRKIHAPLPEEL